MGREKQLYHEINGLKYYKNWVETLEEIYHAEMHNVSPRVYFYTQIRSIELYKDAKLVEWMDIVV